MTDSQKSTSRKDEVRDIADRVFLQAASDIEHAYFLYASMIGGPMLTKDDRVRRTMREAIEALAAVEREMGVERRDDEEQATD